MKEFKLLSAALLLTGCGGVFVTACLAASDVPLPRPKPVSDITPVPRPQEKPDAKTGKETKAPVKPELPKQPVPVFDVAATKACEAELRKLRVQFTIGEDIKGEGPCGVRRPIHLSRLRGGIKVTGKPRVNCNTALAVARWMREVVVPSAKLHLKAEPNSLMISTSYQCRRRNNLPTGKLSEHAFGNGVDIMGFGFEGRDNVMIAVRDGSEAERAFQAAARGGSCAYFTTVLGPGTNAAHATHFHLDVVKRRGGYRLCE